MYREGETCYQALAHTVLEAEKSHLLVGPLDSWGCHPR